MWMGAKVVSNVSLIQDRFRWREPAVQTLSLPLCQRTLNCHLPHICWADGCFGFGGLPVAANGSSGPRSASAVDSSGSHQAFLPTSPLWRRVAGKEERFCFLWGPGLELGGWVGSGQTWGQWRWVSSPRNGGGFVWCSGFVFKAIYSSSTFTGVWLSRDPVCYHNEHVP